MTYVFQNKNRFDDMVAIEHDCLEDARLDMATIVFSYRYKLFSINKVSLKEYQFPNSILKPTQRTQNIIQNF